MKSENSYFHSPLNKEALAKLSIAVALLVMLIVWHFEAIGVVVKALIDVDVEELMMMVN